MPRGSSPNPRKSKFHVKEIKEHIRQEISRKTPKDEDKLREERELNIAHRDWLRNATREQIENKIKEMGILRGTSEYDEILELWRGQQNRQWKNLC